MTTRYSFLCFGIVSFQSVPIRINLRLFLDQTCLLMDFEMQLHINHKKKTIFFNFRMNSFLSDSICDISIGLWSVSFLIRKNHYYFVPFVPTLRKTFCSFSFHLFCFYSNHWFQFWSRFGFNCAKIKTIQIIVILEFEENFLELGAQFSRGKCVRYDHMIHDFLLIRKTEN